MPEVTCHESSKKKITKGKTTIFTNILTAIYCGRGHWQYERFFVNKEFHMIQLHLKYRCGTVFVTVQGTKNAPSKHKGS